MSRYNKLHKRAELRFDVEIDRYRIVNLHKGNERYERVDSAVRKYTLNEIKDVLFSTLEEFERYESIRDSEIHSRYEMYKVRGKELARFIFQEDIEDRGVGYVTYIKVTKPDFLNVNTFAIMFEQAKKVVPNIKTASMRRLAELKFDVEIVKQQAKHMSRSKVLARVDKKLSLKEIKNVLISLKKDFERNQKLRDSFIDFRYDLLKGTTSDLKQYIGGRYTLTEEIDDRHLVYQTLVRVIKPDNLPKSLFEKIIKDMADVLR